VKRIAAVAALIVAMLAVPAAAAMASTASPGPGQPGWGRSCQPNPFHHRHFRGNHHRRHHGHHRFFSNNCFPPPPPAGYCNGQTFTFSWAHDSNSLFEESGPTLYSGEQFSYNGYIYTIGTANPTAGSMTLTSTNYGPTIFYGVGYLCSSYG
jgi:hypothetical protein